MNYSVLLPVYYKENPEYLDESIKSMLAQTASASEIVIVRDGALTQQLDAVIDGYVSRYGGLFKTVTLSKNSGLAAALNEGLKHCGYELVARMDSDDISKPERCERQLEEFMKNSRLSAVGTMVDEFAGTAENIMSRRVLPTDNKAIKEFARLRNPMNHPTVMFKKSDVLSCGGYKTLYFHEDYYLWARMLQKGMEFKNIDQSLLLMRVDKGTYERRGGIRYLKYNFELRRRLYGMGFTSLRQFVFGSLLHGMVILLPGGLRRLMYRFVRGHRLSAQM